MPLNVLLGNPELSFKNVNFLELFDHQTVYGHKNSKGIKKRVSLIRNIPLNKEERFEQSLFAMVDLVLITKITDA